MAEDQDLATQPAVEMDTVAPDVTTASEEHLPGGSPAGAVSTGVLQEDPTQPKARRKKLAIAYWCAIVWVVLVVGSAALAPFLPLPDPIESDFSAIAKPPSSSHIFGTDEVGRDLLSRSIFGARISLAVGLASVAIGLVVGGAFGLMAGYLRGRIEKVIMTATDSLLALPALILLLTIAAVLGQSLRNIILGLAVLTVPTFVRLTRASCLVISQREFVTASRSYGSGPIRVMLREILPNVFPPIAAYCFIIIGVVIVAEGSLSFLGLGVTPPTASWGGMIAGGRISLTHTPHIAMVPSAVMFVTVLAFNVIGERLRKRFDVRESSL